MVDRQNNSHPLAGLDKDAAEPESKSGLETNPGFDSKPGQKTNPGLESKAGSEARPRPLSDAIFRLILEKPKLGEEIAMGLLKRAAEGDVRAFVTLREILEREPGEEDEQLNYEEIQAIEERILELLRDAPELVNRVIHGTPGQVESSGHRVIGSSVSTRCFST